MKLEVMVLLPMNWQLRETLMLHIINMKSMLLCILVNQVNFFRLGFCFCFVDSRDVLFAESLEALYFPSIDSFVFCVASSNRKCHLCYYIWMLVELPHHNGQTLTTIEQLFVVLEFSNSKVSNVFLQVLVDLFVNWFSWSSSNFMSLDSNLFG